MEKGGRQQDRMGPRTRYGPCGHCIQWPTRAIYSLKCPEPPRIVSLVREKVFKTPILIHNALGETPHIQIVMRSASFYKEDSTGILLVADQVKLNSA